MNDNDVAIDIRCGTCTCTVTATTLDVAFGIVADCVDGVHMDMDNGDGFDETRHGVNDNGVI